MTNPVLAALAQARLRAAPMFARWCELNGASFCPAAPQTLARFVKDCSALGIERLWPAVQDVAKLHASLGLADPTLGGPAADAIGEIAAVMPPRSWPEEYKQRFKSLPYDIQLFVAAHEIRREKTLRRAQNDAAASRQKLAASEQSAIKLAEGAKNEDSARADT
ncbi:hypothetical protein [Bradyrhizobium sp. Tv2a-2]|uniref:hypothetical protein n=1 Tax=Bradyrhizobium sp. Tv2a-2 TaxID=113395 RepID=UPI0004264497|nr:hypothetical protein [Bradyrhizobium sp. Tv2a-2]